ncbi:MAG: hypothetical protein KDD40_11450, partial [Bdellovibrionales bacterium]|nr:hypothetical protein [Bdellovibrionales bacterium]
PIKESAYYGNSSEVISYGAYRLLEAKRILDIALYWEKVDLTQPKNKLENFLAQASVHKPGFIRLKGCGGKDKKVLIDIQNYSANKIQFTLGYKNCSIQSSAQLSTKLFGFENFELSFLDSYEIVLKGGKYRKRAKRILQKVVYFTNDFRWQLSGKEENPLFKTSASWARINEMRQLNMDFREGGYFFFNYETAAEFIQNLKGKTIKSIEPLGKQHYFASGNFLVNKSKVEQLQMGGFHLEHNAPREVYCSSNCQRLIFKNDKNIIEVAANFSNNGLQFDKECSYIRGKLQGVDYINYNEKRNRFFAEPESLANDSRILNYLVNDQRGKMEQLQLSDENGKLLTQQNLKCLLKPTNLEDLAQPKTPFDLIYLK